MSASFSTACRQHRCAQSMREHQALITSQHSICCSPLGWRARAQFTASRDRLPSSYRASKQVIYAQAQVLAKSAQGHKAVSR